MLVTAGAITTVIQLRKHERQQRNRSDRSDSGATEAIAERQRFYNGATTEQHRRQYQEQLRSNSRRDISGATVVQ